MSNEVKFYRLMATDESPQFEPVGNYKGTWWGVAMVEDAAEIARLDKRGCRQISQQDYEAAVKKKLGQQDSLGTSRPVPDSTQMVSLIERPAAPPVAKSVEPPDVSSVVKASKVPLSKRVK